MLFLFDIDGTLVRSFIRDTPGGDRPEYDMVEVLPGRREKLDALRAEGHDIALVTNQAGVAMGYQDPPQVCRKIAKVIAELGLAPAAIAHGLREHRDLAGLPIEATTRPAAYVSFEHPNARLERYRRDWHWRKPGPGMLLCAMVDHGYARTDTMFVGDMDSDRAAAEAAGVQYEDATSFFGSGDN